uniref:flagellar filament capping protein FliD n=1 Tax=Pseudomonas sp. TaxID=306 RepID=UPI0025863548
MSTSVNGVGSGIDIDSIVTALVTAQKTPKQDQITNAKTTATTTLSAVSSLKSALSTFQTAMTDLNVAKSFAGLTATSSNSDSLTATVGTGAAAGTYSIKTTQLATSSKVATQYITSGTTFSAGTLTLTQGSSALGTIKVAANASLSTIRDSINTQLKSSGVTANIITDSTGQRLVISSSTTGASTDISVAASSGLESLAIDGSAETGSVATATKGGYVTAPTQDAEYTIDGLSMTSSTNDVSGAISGVDFTLVAASDTATTLTVDTNTDGLTTSINSFVSAYNTLMSSIDSLTSVTSTTDDDGNATTTGAALTSDSSVRNIVNGLRNALVGSSTSGGTISLLSQLGVSTQTDGTLKVDDDKLETALEANASSVEGFFTGTGGLITRMSASLDIYTQD